MTGAIIILLITVAVGLLLYVTDLKYRRKHPDNDEEEDASAAEGAENEPHGEICCGRHLICEKSLSPLPDEEIVYYDDEELDRFAGKAPDDYTEEEIEEVRDVMTTLLPEDIAGWVRSLQLRRIEFPVALRDELFLLLECE